MKKELEEDYRKIVRGVLLQAIEDYIKLQHPKTRSKKYLQEAFWDAVDMFFDSSYKLAHLLNEDGVQMSLRDVAQVAADRENIDLEALQNHVIKEALDFWSRKPLNTIVIPSTIVIDGHVYVVMHKPDLDDGWDINLTQKTIMLNKDVSDSENQEQFMHAMVALVAHHNDIKIPMKSQRVMASGLFRLLRINDCFTGD